VLLCALWRPEVSQVRFMREELCRHRQKGPTGRAERSKSTDCRGTFVLCVKRPTAEVLNPCILGRARFAGNGGPAKPQPYRMAVSKGVTCWFE